MMETRQSEKVERHPSPLHDYRESSAKYGTVACTEDGELLPKSDIVESQLATSLESRDESANQRRNHASMVPADRRLINFGAGG